MNVSPVVELAKFKSTNKRQLSNTSRSTDYRTSSLSRDRSEIGPVGCEWFHQMVPLAVQHSICKFWAASIGKSFMATVAQELGEMGHCSVLLRIARRLGLNSRDDFIRLAVSRGCRHYAPAYPPIERDPGSAAISNEELVALLLRGSNEFEPIAIRCAAQLAGSCDAESLVRVAKRERVGRPLAYIANAGRTHDLSHKEFWVEVMGLLGEQSPITDGILPHWSRFVSQTGVTRSGGGSVQWLHCQ